MPIASIDRNSDSPKTDPAQFGDRADDGSGSLGDVLKSLMKLLEKLLKKMDDAAGKEGGGGGEGANAPAGGGAPLAAGADKPAGGAPAGNTSGPPPAGAGAPPAGAGGKPDAPEPGAGSSGPLGKEAQKTANTSEQTKAVSEQYITNLQNDFGLTREQAVGVVANLSHESAGMNSGINQGGQIGSPSGNTADDNANGFGIAQWGGVRKEGLIAYAKQNGLDPSSQEANYGFLKQELKGEYSGVIDAVKGTGSAEEATKVFSQQYEKPSDPQMESRLQIARDLLS
jgi:Phage tail lysozyme